MQADDNPDANALTPVAVTVALADGRRHEIMVEDVYGSPARPMGREARLAKFRRNWISGAAPLDERAGEALIARGRAAGDGRPTSPRLLDLLSAR